MTPAAKSAPARRRRTTQRWFVYVARCADGTLYTGVAVDVVARIAAHDAGKGAKYTRGRGPLSVCAVRGCRDKREAQRLEWLIKQLSRARKDLLITSRTRLARFARAALMRASAPKRRLTS